MPRAGFPTPRIALSRTEARRFLLAQQGLLPPRRLHGKEGILDFIGRAGCIQYDPVNLVGQNPELVLQARVAEYTPALLAELLYDERRLIDGWDKQAAIYRTEDWPYFARQRAEARRRHGDPSNPPMAIAEAVKSALRERGPLCSADLGHNDTIDWWWGVPTCLGRATLAILYGMGEVGVHHRVHTRRYFDLIERLLPTVLLNTPDPNSTEELYLDWHVARRIGGLGIASPNAGEQWLGMAVTERRRRALIRLCERGDLVPIAVEGVGREPLFMRASDRLLLDQAAATVRSAPTATFIGPLDNLIWDRDLVRRLFDFDYTWEVYKPAAKRRYGHYVLPVLCGDRFIARVEPVFDRKARVLTVVNWWWESGTEPDSGTELDSGTAPDDSIFQALTECFAAFGRYLGAEAIRFGEAVGDARLRRAIAQVV